MKEHFEINADANDITDEKWHLDRRKWLKLAIAGGILLQLPWWTSCTSDSDSGLILDGKGIFTNSEMRSILALQNTLVPEDGNGPSAQMVNAHNYFVWYLSSGLSGESDYTYFVENLKTLFQICSDKFGHKLHDLDEQQQIKFVQNQIEEGWTRSYLSRMITLIFEAMLFDPIYGGNTNEIGWDWLDHIPGSPRPTIDTKYPDITKKLRHNV